MQKKESNAEIIEHLDMSPVMGTGQNAWEDFLDENVFASGGGFLFNIESDFYGVPPEELTKKHRKLHCCK